jgi:hypothetical protein
MLDRVFYPPNKCSKALVAISQKFYCRKEAWAMQKLFIKKELKNGQVSEISKIMGTQMSA